MENVNRQNSSKGNSSVDDEVKQLFKRSGGKISQVDFQRLRTKYGNEDLVEKIERAFIDKYTEINKKAKKFATLIREKYSNSQYPYHILLDKALKYKAKHNLSDEEFSEFQRIYENELAGIKSNDIVIPSTNLQKVLGNVSVDYQGFQNKLSDSDFKVLNDILKLNATTKSLHSQVLLQSMQYQDCSIEALTGKYDQNLHTVSNHIHPVIVALFLPKINVLENHFIHSNISNIVKARYNKEQFSSIADALLYDALVRDPNDVVCDSKSTLVDLYNRAQLQVQVWNSVLSLRNGQYYNNSFREFINSVDNCKMNKYDSPDLVYGRYDGTILKRLVSAFSFRPTITTAMPIYPLFNANPYQQNVVPTVTYVSMINLKLPFSATDNSPVLLRDSLEQTQLLIENGLAVPKHTSLIYSKGVLIFYVDRRANTIVQNLHPTFIMNQLPTATSGFQRLNKRPVNYDNVFGIKSDQYRLRSVVVSETSNLDKNAELVVGSSTLIMKHRDFQDSNDDEFLIYDPYCVAKASIQNGQVVRHNSPIHLIDDVSPNDEEDGFKEAARCRGIIFVYELAKDETSGIISY